MCGREYYMNEFEVKVLDGIQDLAQRMVRVETKLDTTSARIDTHETRLSSLERSIPDPDHEARLRKLERWMWLATGIAAAAGGAAGGVLQSIMGM